MSVIQIKYNHYQCAVGLYSCISCICSSCNFLLDMWNAYWWLIADLKLIRGNNIINKLSDLNLFRFPRWDLKRWEWRIQHLTKMKCQCYDLYSVFWSFLLNSLSGKFLGGQSKSKIRVPVSLCLSLFIKSSNQKCPFIVHIFSFFQSYIHPLFMGVSWNLEAPE